MLYTIGDTELERPSVGAHSVWSTCTIQSPGNLQPL